MLRTRSIDAVILWQTAMCLLLITGGCYPYARHVALSYSVPAGAGPRFNGRGVPVVVSSFTDSRPDRRVLGHISSAVVVTGPDVTADNEPGQWIAGAIRTELAHERYAATSADQIPPAGAYGVDGTVIKAFCYAAGHYTADVIFDARVTRDGKTLFTKRYTGHGDKGMMVAGSPELMADALNDALSKAVDQFVIDFHRGTMNEVGAVSAP